MYLKLRNINLKLIFKKSNKKIYSYKNIKQLISKIRQSFEFSKKNKLNFVNLEVFYLKEISIKDIAKIFAEEISKYILENPNTKIKNIIFYSDSEIKIDQNLFLTTIFEHIGYINRKVGLYPIPTVDIIIEINSKHKQGIVLIERENPPYGIALPGGFVEYNESLEQAAIREAKEETGLLLSNLVQFHTYSDPKRDPRFHTISTVFISSSKNIPQASSDARKVLILNKKEIFSGKYNFAFDHKKILKDYFKLKK